MNWYFYEKKKITLKSTSSDVKMWNPEAFVLDFSVWPVTVTYVGASSITENGNTYFKCVSILLKVTFCQNKRVRDPLRVLLLTYQNFMKTKCFLSKLTHACNCVQVRILLKNPIFKSWKLSQKQNFIFYLVTSREWLTWHLFHTQTWGGQTACSNTDLRWADCL